MLLLFVSAGFIESAQRTHPIIETVEWNGLLELKENRPDIGFGLVSGGLRYWVEAAGFSVGPDGAFTLICVSENGGTNHWLNDGCMQSAAVVPPFLAREIDSEGRIGRFLLVRIDALPEDFRGMEEPPPDLNPPPQ